MGIKYFTIEYDHEVYCPGQRVSGRVCLSIDEPKKIRGVELSLCSTAECRWTRRRSYRRANGRRDWRTVTYYGKETFFETKLKLAGGKQKFELPSGDHVWPFSVSLPAPLPPSYKGTYGGITYCGKAKLDLPWALDKHAEKQILVENPIDLNYIPELNEPYQSEKSKKFCCCCCASRPLTVTVLIPRTGFVPNEAIPITIDVENASNVEVDFVKIELKQIIDWKAVTDSKTESVTMKSCKLSGVGARACKTWDEVLELGPDTYPNSGICHIVKIRYELEVNLSPKGPHCSLRINTPITIGDVPFRSSLPISTLSGVGFPLPRTEKPSLTCGHISSDPEVLTAHSSSAQGTPTNYGTLLNPGGLEGSNPETAAPPNPSAPYPDATDEAWYSRSRLESYPLLSDPVGKSSTSNSSTRNW